MKANVSSSLWPATRIPLHHGTSSVLGGLNSLRPRRNGRHFADDIFKCIFLNENVWIPMKISLKFVPNGTINNIPALVRIMAWRRPGDKPLSEPMMVRLPTHICATRPQWVNIRNFTWKSYHNIYPQHYNDVIMDAIMSQITNLTIVDSTVYFGADQRKHQSSASLAFVRGIHRSSVNCLHKGPVTRKMFPLDDVILNAQPMANLITVQIIATLFFTIHRATLLHHNHVDVIYFIDRSR